MPSLMMPAEVGTGKRRILVQKEQENTIKEYSEQGIKTISV